MNKTLSKLVIAQAALFSVKPFAPLVAIFYCMSTTSEQALAYSLWAALIFLFFLILQCMVVVWLYRPVGAALANIADPVACPDSVLEDIAYKNSALPLRLSLLFFVSILTACAADYVVYRATSIGALSAASIWGGMVAGALACPFMVLGTTSLVLGKNTETIANELRKRELKYTPLRIGIFPKLVGCFAAFSVGLAIWLGSAGFYSGINQTIEEMKYGDGQWLKSITLSIEQQAASSNAASVFKSLAEHYPDRHLFLADRSGQLLASAHDDTFDIKRWTAQKKALLDGLASGRQGSVYENVNERVISWAPLGKEHLIGAFSYVSDRLSRFTQFYIWFGVFILVGFSVGMALGITNVLATSRSVNRAGSALQDLAEGEGDLTVRLAITGEDEVGDLARGFNKFIDKLYYIIQNVVEKSENIRMSSNQFSELSKNMSSDVEVLQQETAQVSQVTGDTSQELTTVSSGCEETASNVNQVSAAAEEMAVSVQEVAKQSEAARQIAEDAVVTTKNASEKIEKLGAAAKGIDKVTEVITEISEQINLLALNATIESARAGEAGKGFAVVANEIKELARQTAQATNEIKQRIDGIQTSTDDTVRDMGEISRVIGSVNEFVYTIAGAVEEQTQTTREIASNIAQVSAGVSDVNNSVAKSAETSRDMSTQMEQVHIKTENISQNSRQVDDSARGLFAISEALNEQLSKFKL